MSQVLCKEFYCLKMLLYTSRPLVSFRYFSATPLNFFSEIFGKILNTSVHKISSGLSILWRTVFQITHSFTHTQLAWNLVSNLGKGESSENPKLKYSHAITHHATILTNPGPQLVAPAPQKYFISIARNSIFSRQINVKHAYFYTRGRIY